VAVGVNEWFDGVDTLHLLWVHPEVFFNGWSFEASEYLHSLRIVKVRPVDIPKSKDGRYEALVDILAVIDPWEVAGHTPKEVGSLDRISPTRGVTAIVSSGDRTVVYRCDDSDQTFQYYLCKNRTRILLLTDEGPTASFFYWGNGALSKTQLEEAIGAIERINSHR